MAYETYTLRSPDRATFIADLKAALSEAGIDPYEKDLLRTDKSGEEVLHRFLDFIPPGQWHITEPTIGDDGTVIEEGVKADYALINAITKDPELIAFIESFETSGASLQPSEIPDSEKIGGGTHRVDQSTISSPERTW